MKTTDLPKDWQEWPLAERAIWREGYDKGYRRACMDTKTEQLTLEA